MDFKVEASVPPAEPAAATTPERVVAPAPVVEAPVVAATPTPAKPPALVITPPVAAAAEVAEMESLIAAVAPALSTGWRHCLAEDTHPLFPVQPTTT